MPGTPERQPLRVGGWHRFDIWAEHASEKQREEAYALLFRICDGTDEVVADADTFEDLTDGTIRHSFLGAADVLSWRSMPDYPGTLQIVYVGPIELF